MFKESVHSEASLKSELVAAHCLKLINYLKEEFKCSAQSKKKRAKIYLLYEKVNKNK